MRTEAEIVGYNKKFVWIRVPFANATHRILTLPRATLKRGFAKAKLVEIEWSPASLKRTTYYTADVELISIVSTRSKTDDLDPG